MGKTQDTLRLPLSFSMGDIIPITSVAHSVDLIPAFWYMEEPPEDNSIKYSTGSYLNNLSDKETYPDSA